MSEKQDVESAAGSTRSPVYEAPQDEPVYLDPKIEARILHKLDWGMLPVLWFLFLVSFVDKSNIGNAKIQGMATSLHLTGDKYNIAVMVFTLAYITCAIPANMVFKHYGPRSLAVMMFIWSFFAIGQGLTTTWGGLVACRFLMGVFEAGFVPGCAFLIGSYYTRTEFLRRYAVFFSASIVSGAFNGLFSYALAHANGAGGLDGWRWIFLVEGIITGCVAIITFFTIIKFPEDTKTFTPEEKAVLLERIRQDGGRVEHDQPSKHLVEALTDWKIWLAMLAYATTEENASAVTAFQPTVLKGLGYSAEAAQVHSIPIYCTAFVVSLSAAWLSDRLRQRYAFAITGVIIILIGNVIEVVHPSVGVRYMGMFFITCGAYIAMPIMVVWAAVNVTKGYKRNVAFGLVIGTGNFTSLISSNVFITSQSPVFKTGFSVGIGMACASGLFMTALFIGLKLENRKKDRQPLPMSDTLADGFDGEKDPRFRYQT